MMLPDFSFYTAEFGGTAVPEESFSPCAVRAARKLNADTFGRAARALHGNSADADAVKHCICALTELEYARMEGTDTPVQHESLGSWSRTYLHAKSDSPRALRRAAEEEYLGSTGLLYRGRGSRVS